MRIPVGSCQACLRDEKIYPNGRHVDENGQWYICPFVTATLADIKDVELISVHTTRRAAVKASGGYGPIEWIGQSPRELWLALRDVEEVSE
jgi:hypothetical protein